MNALTPILHAGGSSKDRLFEEWLEAKNAAHELLSALEAIDFNARDYVPMGGTSAWRAAQVEFAAMQKAVKKMEETLYDVVMEIDAQ